MKHKNSWNKVYETIEKVQKIKLNGQIIENKKTKKVQTKSGMKPSHLELKFAKRIKYMDTDKPKGWNGKWD